MKGSKSKSEKEGAGVGAGFRRGERFGLSLLLGPGPSRGDFSYCIGRFGLRWWVLR
jgi:hypothetical protein